MRVAARNRYGARARSAHRSRIARHASRVPAPGAARSERRRFDVVSLARAPRAERSGGSAADERDRGELWSIACGEGAHALPDPAADCADGLGRQLAQHHPDPDRARLHVAPVIVGGRAPAPPPLRTTRSGRSASRSSRSRHAGRPRRARSPGAPALRGSRRETGPRAARETAGGALRQGRRTTASASSAPHTSAAKRPPGRSTLRASRTPATRLGKNMSPSCEITVSKISWRRASACPSIAASRIGRGPGLASAPRSIGSETSTPTIVPRAPTASAAIDADSPVPVAISSTRWPGATCAARSSAGTYSRVQRPMKSS